jgi:hypothetical protein
VLHPQAKQAGVVKQVMCEGNIKIFAQKTENLKYIYIYQCKFEKTRGVKDIIESLGSQLVSGNYHENKVSVVMAMASDPPWFC